MPYTQGRIPSRREDRIGEWAQETGVGMGSGLRTRVATFLNFVEKGIYAIYSGKGPSSEGGSEKGVGSEKRSGGWT